MSEVENKKGKKVNPLVFVIMLVLLCVFGVGGFAIGSTSKKCSSTTVSENTNKGSSSENEKDTVTDNEDANEDDSSTTSAGEEQKSTVTSTNKARCYGTYYVNNNASEGKYTLTEDGKFSVEGQELSGVFVIHENTITFIESKHTVGPREEDNYYDNPKSYLISDDCSKIRLTASGSHTSAELVKQN